MGYPYNGKLAAEVGGGLGGLPQRKTVAAAVSAAVRKKIAPWNTSTGSTFGIPYNTYMRSFPAKIGGFWYMELCQNNSPAFPRYFAKWTFGPNGEILNPTYVNQNVDAAGLVWPSMSSPAPAIIYRMYDNGTNAALRAGNGLNFVSINGSNLPVCVSRVSGQSSGTYANNGAASWTSVSAYGDGRGCYVDDDGTSFVMVRDNFGRLAVHVYTPAGVFVKGVLLSNAVAPAASYTSYQNFFVEKTAYGYCFVHSTTNVSNVAYITVYTTDSAFNLISEAMSGVSPYNSANGCRACGVVFGPAGIVVTVINQSSGLSSQDIFAQIPFSISSTGVITKKTDSNMVVDLYVTSKALQVPKAAVMNGFDFCFTSTDILALDVPEDYLVGNGTTSNTSDVTVASYSPAIFLATQSSHVARDMHYAEQQSESTPYMYNFPGGYVLKFYSQEVFKSTAIVNQ